MLSPTEEIPISCAYCGKSDDEERMLLCDGTILLDKDGHIMCRVVTPNTNGGGAHDNTSSDLVLGPNVTDTVREIMPNLHLPKKIQRKLAAFDDCPIAAHIYCLPTP